MRPVPIPDTAIPEGARRIVVAAPDGDLTNPDIAPVEAIVRMEDGVRWYSVLLVPEGDDYANLRNGHPITLSFAGGIPVFQVDVHPPE
jgi:hypothetical protein